MAYEIPGFKLTLEAGADLSAAQYKFVTLNGSGQVVVCSAVTDNPIGILQDKPAAAGRAAEIMVSGVSKVDSDAALTVNSMVGPSADGQAAAYVHGTDTTKYIVGRVLEASSGAGVKATILFDCMGAQGRAA